MKNHVTVGVDGSDESLAAARWAAREAVVRQVPLRLVHAVDWLLDPVLPGVGRQDADSWTDRAVAEAAEELRRRHPRLEITTRCPTGRPAAALAAEAVDCALLVLGSRGLGGLTGFLVGSVALSAVAATDTPVVLVRSTGEPDTASESEAEPGAGAGIVVGIDIQEACDRVLTFAFEEAERRGCTLQVVHTWKMPPAYSYVPLFDSDNERDIQRSVARTVEDMLLPWRRRFPDVDVSTGVYEGSASERLVHASRGAGLVVVGRHLRHSPLGPHLGPVTHAVLHHTAAPVAVVAHP
ncbi:MULTISPECIES: universal stress protein [Streptomyces]|uniref:universal stress protein n=1 Tax=Streptomyces TaxID=1883 RepID=UPI0029D0E11F|nr:universal stress protein [Streptomyces sp. F8]MDX6759741.1 universal stress protein [Streptomyces sp. F8]